MKANNNYSFTFIDLFAGLGGIRLPFEQLGGKCVFSSEWDKFAQKSYEAFHGEKPHGDITKIQSSEIPDFDVLLGGFPCQAFSHAGKKQGFADTRGTMFFEIERILKDKKPKAFLLENVKGLKSHDKGRTFATIVEKLEKLGYTVQTQVLNARDFGLPQNRERIYLVGFLSAKDASQFSFPTPPSPKTKLGDILERSVDPKYTISDKLWAGTCAAKKSTKRKVTGLVTAFLTKTRPTLQPSVPVITKMEVKFSLNKRAKTQENSPLLRPQGYRAFLTLWFKKPNLLE